MQSLTPEVRQQLLKFPVGTIVESQSGEHIGHVVGYHMHENKAYWEEFDTTNVQQWTYQLKVTWATTIETRGFNAGDIRELINIVDFNDVKPI